MGDIPASRALLGFFSSFFHFFFFFAYNRASISAGEWLTGCWLQPLHVYKGSAALR